MNGILDDITCRHEGNNHIYVCDCGHHHSDHNYAGGCLLRSAGCKCERYSQVLKRKPEQQ